MRSCPVIWITILCSLLQLYQAAGQVRFSATAEPSAVEAGASMQVHFTLEQADSEQLQPPEWGPFRVLAGPGRSMSIQIINGSRSSSITWTYMLQAPVQAGRYTLPSARVRVGSRWLQSGELHIQVTPAGKRSTAGKGHTTDGEPDYFLRLEADTTEAFPGQQITLTCKLYARINIQSYEWVREPDIAQAYLQPVEHLDQSVHEERLGRHSYYSKVIRKMYLYPQTPGALEIDPFVLRLALPRTQGESKDAWGFFLRDLVFEEVSSGPLTIRVRDIPAGAPPAFDGAVGEWQVDTDVPIRKIKAGATCRILVRISGSGDLKRVNPPAIEWPSGFELYSTRMIDEQHHGAQPSMPASRTFEYLVVPDQPGSYRISSGWSYLDARSGRFREAGFTLPEIEVLPPDPGSSTGLATPGEHTRPETFDQDQSSFSTGKTAAAAISLLALLASAILLVRRSKKTRARQPAVQAAHTSMLSATLLEQSYRSSVSSGDPAAFYHDLRLMIYRWLFGDSSAREIFAERHEWEERLHARVSDPADARSFSRLWELSGQALYAPHAFRDKAQEICEEARRLFDKYK